MKIEHKLEPLMQIKERKDNIQVYGCFQVGFNFMLKPDIEVPITFMQEFIPRMMKAACDVKLQAAFLFATTTRPACAPESFDQTGSAEYFNHTRSRQTSQRVGGTTRRSPVPVR